MSYQVLARKYRPQQFDDVIGQSVITTTLKNAIAQKRIGHAYLFSGVRGVGKTTSARILAKALNCAQGPTPTPCETCDSCREIKNGNAVDVIEIDAASNRSIDDIRQLRENVKYRPARDRYKIYIIDEAHQLTDDAWDALLKTLEEPPDHVVFIFATTERHKLKPTILSRCQNFSFRMLSYHEIFSSLEAICRTEQIEATPGALSMLARSAEGSIRDAQSLLDQVISFCGNSIDEAKIRELLGFVAQEYLDRVSEALVARDTTAMLKLVDDVLRAGFDARHFCREVIQHIRNLMIVRVAGNHSELLELPLDAGERLAAVAAHFSEEDLVRFFHLLSRTENDLKWSTHPRLHLELGLVRLVQAARLMSIEEFLSDWKAGKPAAEPRVPGAPPSSPSVAAPPLKKNSESRSSAVPTGRQAVAAGRSGDAGAPPSAVTVTPASLPPPARDAFGAAQSKPAPKSAAVESLRQALYAKSKFLDSMLDHAARIEVENSFVHLRFSEANQHFISILNSKGQIATLNQICQNVFGKNFQVKLSVTDDGGEEIPAAGLPVGAASRGLGEPRTRRGGPHKAGTDADDAVTRNPLVKSFLDTFHAEIVEQKKK